MVLGPLSKESMTPLVISAKPLPGTTVGCQYTYYWA